MLVLASFGLLIPAIFHELPEVTARDIGLEHELSIGVSVILIFTYLAHLVFSLVTHKSLFNPDNDRCSRGGRPLEQQGQRRRS